MIPIHRYENPENVVTFCYKRSDLHEVQRIIAADNGKGVSDTELLQATLRRGNYISVLSSVWA